MARLYLFAEGLTEVRFAKEVIGPHLADRGVYLHNPVQIAHCKKKGRVHRGGGRNYLPMKNDILRFCKQERGGDVFFTTLIDLYALPSGFPGLSSDATRQQNPREYAGFLEQALAKDVGDPRFIPHLQLHEFEACLFSNPERFDVFFEHQDKEIEELVAVAGAFPDPEWIDDGPDSAPSNRIEKVFPEYPSVKSVAGPMIAAEIGLNTIRERCPHFSAWIAQLERLAHISVATI